MNFVRGNQMRFLTWNLGHQTRPKPLPASIGSALAKLSPDVVVLTEYVYDDSHRPFLDALKEQGLAHRLVSDHVLRQNQVLIASRYPMERGGITCAVGLSDATGPNWLHVRLATGADVVGFRRPMFKAVTRAVTKYWEWLGTAIEPLSVGPAVMLGDFNAVSTSRFLRRPVTNGWQLVTPRTGWSFQGKTGLCSASDHALVSRDFQIMEAAYTPYVPGCTFAGSSDAYSDHAVFRFELERRIAGAS